MAELRTRSAGAKVTEKEYAEIEKLAESRGLKVGEWCRETLLARLSGQEPRAATDCAGTGQVALMAELSALRAILLNVLFKLANGQMLTGEEMQRLIDRADSDKLKKARDRLARARVGRARGRKILIVFRASTKEFLGENLQPETLALGVRLSSASRRATGAAA
jgi:hypothetical protein